MRFGPIPLAEAAGAILAHTHRRGRLVLKKGHRLAPDDIERLAEAGVTELVAARLEDGDVHEDEAARRIATAVTGDGLTLATAFTGRVNLTAEAAGLLVVDGAGIDALNTQDEAITLATLPAYAPLAAGYMAATVKIIPFAAPVAAVARIEETARLSGPLLRLARYRTGRAHLIQTRLPGTADKVLDKTAAITAERLAAVGWRLAGERRCDHAEPPLAQTLADGRDDPADLVLIAGASAITDRADVLPAAIEAAGGTVEHFGMPVDPGNLLLLARLGAVPVIGLPGCARSPKLNGFDWVLQRLAAGLPMAPRDITGLGVGGLLAEIPSRPQPRASRAGAGTAGPKVAAIILAAGRSRRMGPDNKLLSPVAGRAMVTHAVDAALASRADPVVVVTGHERDRVTRALAGRPVTLVDNPDHGDGLSRSLKAGIAALPAEIDGAIILLGDMPLVSAALIDRLIAGFAPVEGRSLIVPSHDGRRGNPVLWGRAYFAEIEALTGDVGARPLLHRHESEVTELAVDDPAVLIDIDTADMLRALDADDSAGAA